MLSTSATGSTWPWPRALPQQLDRRPQIRVAIVVKRHMGRLGQSTGDFTGHSLRRSHATTAASIGATERTIMCTTDHTSTQTVCGYIEDGELFSDLAPKYLGL